MRAFIAIVLAGWLALVVLLGAASAFPTGPGQPAFPILLAVVVPVLLFVLGYAASQEVRAFTQQVDLPLITALQAWRFAGFGFVALYAYGVLPGLFAWPAGLGDMAIGFTAPWVALALVRRPAFAHSSQFVVWNLLGILDLVVAVSIGGALSALATGAPGEITTRPMALLPLLLIPAFMVPLFLILHFIALVRSRQPARVESPANSLNAGADLEAVHS
jgi:hypothetical protein